jgi:hypothetical protein
MEAAEREGGERLMQEMKEQDQREHQEEAMEEQADQGLNPGAARIFTRDFKLRLLGVSVEGFLEGLLLALLLHLIIKL